MSQTPYPDNIVERVAHMRCFDCGQPTASYMVHNEVWTAAWPKGKPSKRALAEQATAMFPDRPRKRRPASNGATLIDVYILLCFACLERRIGRELTLDDFQLTNRDGTRPLAVNAGILLGYRMGRQSLLKSGDKKEEGG